MSKFDIEKKNKIKLKFNNKIYLAKLSISWIFEFSY